METVCEQNNAECVLDMGKTTERRSLCNDLDLDVFPRFQKVVFLNIRADIVIQ